MAGMLLLLTAGGVFVWWSLQTQPSRQATAHATALERLGFIGSARCAECHQDEAALHDRSGHARALAHTRDSSIAMSLSGLSIPARDGYEQFEFAHDEEGLIVAVPKVFGDKWFPVDLAFGSGDHAQTYLTLTAAPDAEGGVIGIEHRHTWFRHTGACDITPGQATWIPGRKIEHFGKAFEGELLHRCIRCHTTHYEVQGDQLENAMFGVQCEACHGPGRDHAAAAEAREFDRAKRLLRRPQTPHEEVQLCGRCHRLPEDIDPERLQRYPPSVVRFQPVGLMQSRCYLESDGRLGCLNCHDPHGHVTTRSKAEQVAACRNCHREGEDALCAAGHIEGCVDCHMRSVEIVPGISFRDHWIRAQPPAVMAPDPEDAASASGEAVAP